jgi:hypothetical protein
MSVKSLYEASKNRKVEMVTWWVKGVKHEFYDKKYVKFLEKRVRDLSAIITREHDAGR